MNEDFTASCPTGAQGGQNKVIVHRSMVHPRFDKQLDRLLRTAIPFFFSFYGIETKQDLHVEFGRWTPGRNGYFVARDPLGNRGAMTIGLNARLFSTYADSYDRVLTTLFHEATHLWQFLNCRDDLDWDEKQKSYVDASDDYEAYYRHPWEVEARRMADVMVDAHHRHRCSYRDRVPCNVSVAPFVRDDRGR